MIIMHKDLFDQLDLAVYLLAPIAWWQSPLVQLIFALVLVVAVVCVIVVVRRRTKRDSVDTLQVLCGMLYHAAHEWQGQRMCSDEALSFLAAIIKRYMQVMTHDSAIGGMTEQEWLEYARNKPLFEPAKIEFVQVGEFLSYYKFCGGCVLDDQVCEAFELAYQIIAKTSNGKLSLTSGLFKIESESIQT